MEEDKLALTFGSLLHDIGKVVYRGISVRGTHSKLGAKFIEKLAAQNFDFGGECGRKIVEQAAVVVWAGDQLLHRLAAGADDTHVVAIGLA